MSLFRKEAVAHQSEKLTGTIILAQPLSIKVTVSIIVVIAITIVSFLFNAQYARKETVRGFLMPSKGVIKSFASQGGTIEKLWVKEGDIVIKGQPLATLIVQQNNSDGSALSSNIIKQLQAQLTLLNDEVQQYLALQIKEVANAQTKQQALQQEQVALKEQLALAQQKLILLLSQQKKFNNLSNQGFISAYDKERQQQELLEARQEKQSVERLLLQLNNQLINIEFELNNIPEQYTLRINALKRQQAEIEQQLSQVKNNVHYTVTASNNGTVTGIQVVQGETLSRTKPLMHILPEGAELVAELLLPTRSAGFIEEGLNTRLRFDAFPYQRFGFMESTVIRIDRALIAPNEVQLPVNLQEPVYRLRAKLNKQQMKAYGKAFNLKSGMLLEADIMLEQRTIVEWLLEPLYSLKGRVS